MRSAEEAAPAHAAARLEAALPEGPPAAPGRPRTSPLRRGAAAVGAPAPPGQGPPEWRAVGVARTPPTAYGEAAEAGAPHPPPHPSMNEP